MTSWKVSPKVASASLSARVAQLDRASVSEAEGCGFDPRRAHHFIEIRPLPRAHPDLADLAVLAVACMIPDVNHGGIISTNAAWAVDPRCWG